MTGRGIVRLVAVHVHGEAAFGGDLAQRADGLGGVSLGALEMRDAADHVHAHVERPGQVGHADGRAQVSVLRKGHELQVEMVPDRFANVEERRDAREARIGRVDVAADGEQAAPDGPVAVPERPRDVVVERERGLQLLPQRDALEKGSRAVVPRAARGQRRVHVKVGIDERRRDQTAPAVDLLCAGGVRNGADGRDSPRLDPDVDVFAPVGKIAAPKDQVHHVSVTSPGRDRRPPR